MREQPVEAIVRSCNISIEAGRYITQDPRHPTSPCI
jgi:hypothetical protein